MGVQLSIFTMLNCLPDMRIKAGFPSPRSGHEQGGEKEEAKRKLKEKRKIRA